MRIKQIVLMRALVALAALAMISETELASADTIVETYTGTILGAYSSLSAVDSAGIFGPAGANLTGDAYSATYVFNTALGTASSSYVEGGTAFSLPNQSPVISATITINGSTYSMPIVSNPLAAQLINFNAGSTSSTLALYQPTRGAGTNFLQNELVSGTTLIPELITQPFTYTFNPAVDPAPTNGSSILYLIGTDGSLAVDLSEGTVQLQVVPLPASGWLMLSALGSLGALARKNRAA